MFDTAINSPDRKDSGEPSHALIRPRPGKSILRLALRYIPYAPTGILEEAQSNEFSSDFQDRHSDRSGIQSAFDRAISGRNWPTKSSSLLSAPRGRPPLSISRPFQAHRTLPSQARISTRLLRRSSASYREQTSGVHFPRA